MYTVNGCSCSAHKHKYFVAAKLNTHVCEFNDVLIHTFLKSQFQILTEMFTFVISFSFLIENIQQNANIFSIQAIYAIAYSK